MYQVSTLPAQCNFMQLVEQSQKLSYFKEEKENRQMLKGAGSTVYLESQGTQMLGHTLFCVTQAVPIRFFLPGPHNWY